MLRTFRKKGRSYNEVIEVNIETGAYGQFFYNVHDGQLLIFNDRHDNLSAMGWKSVNDFIRQRAKSLYPEELKEGFDLYHLTRYVPPNKRDAAAAL